MYNLIIKDLLQVKGTLFFIFLAGLILLIIEYFTGGATSALAFLPFFITFFLLTKNEYYEGNNNGYSFLRTLPIKTSNIVISKFIYVVLVLLVYLIFIYLILLILMPGSLDGIVWITLYVSMVLSLLLSGFFYNLEYKYGAVKAINISRIVFILLYLLIFALGVIFMENSILIRGVYELISPFFNLYTISIFVILIYMYSLKRAIKIFENSEVV